MKQHQVNSKGPTFPQNSKHKKKQKNQMNSESPKFPNITKNMIQNLENDNIGIKSKSLKFQKHNVTTCFENGKSGKSYFKQCLDLFSKPFDNFSKKYSQIHN